MANHVLIVDDEAHVRRLESQILRRGGYECAEAASTAEARGMLAQKTFALALIDINMPGESGLELAKTISAEYPSIAAMMVTGVDDLKEARTAHEYGVHGYLLKPFTRSELLIGVDGAIHRKTQEIESRTERLNLESTLDQRTAALEQAILQVNESQLRIEEHQEDTVLRLSRAAEHWDFDVAQHLQRMSDFCARLARQCGMSDACCEQIRLASMLHDIGKVGVESKLLNKPGALTPEEFKAVQQHVEIGHRILEGSTSELMQLAANIAWTHHEKFDGTGYPRGLAADTIPLEGRIAAIADVYDALTSDRPYRKAYSSAQAREIMTDGRGRHFDPELLDLFFGSLSLGPGTF